MTHSISHAEPMDQKHSINLCNHERYPVHLKCLRNIQKIKYPEFQAMTEILQKDSETLTAYINRFKKEAKHCDFDSHPAKIRIFLKGLINSSRIAPSVYEKGPTTIENTIGIVEKISSAQRIAALFSQNHQISMMKREPTDHHTPNQDCSNCGQLGHPWFTCLCIMCNGCNQCGHIYRHCWDRIPPSGTASPPESHHNHGR